LRDASYAGAKRLGHGERYLYSHDYEGAYVPQAYLPEGRRYYRPSDEGMEAQIAARLEAWREQFERAKREREAERNAESPKTRGDGPESP
jgi:putative ATPase